MRKNESTVIRGNRVVLVPYRREHVDRYHEWMKSEELQELTASEPLSLEQEYEMQESWHKDENKCTFIILDAEKYNEATFDTASMAGDVNLFFNDEENMKTAEIEIMIAEPECRGRGMGREALQAMMFYGVTELGLTSITAKIGYSNTSSQGLFQKLGFQEVSRSEVFKEITLELAITDTAKTALQDSCKHLKITDTMLA